MSNKASESAETILKKLRRLDANMICPNCGTPGQRGIGFGNVCVKFSTFICDLCKTSHQAISHQVKSITMSNWTMEEVNKLMDQRGGGNAAAQHIWLGNAPPYGGKYPGGQRPKQGDRVEIFKQFILDAYEYGKFRADTPYVPQSAASAPAPTAAPTRAVAATAAAPSLSHPASTVTTSTSSASFTADFDFFGSTDGKSGNASPLPTHHHQAPPAAPHPSQQQQQDPFFADFASFDAFSNASTPTPTSSATTAAALGGGRTLHPRSASVPTMPLPPPTLTSTTSGSSATSTASASTRRTTTTTVNSAATASLLDLLDDTPTSGYSSPLPPHPSNTASAHFMQQQQHQQQQQQQQLPAAANTDFDPFGTTPVLSTTSTSTKSNSNNSNNNVLDLFQGLSFDATPTSSATSNMAQPMLQPPQPVMLRPPPMMAPSPAMNMGMNLNMMGGNGYMNHSGGRSPVTPTMMMMGGTGGMNPAMNNNNMNMNMNMNMAGNNGSGRMMMMGGGGGGGGGYTASVGISNINNMAAMQSRGSNNPANGTGSFDFLQDTMRKHLDSAGNNQTNNNNNNNNGGKPVNLSSKTM